ncbi:MAG: exosortase/archaeosortase family protein [Nibricoccus sp.]
MLVFQLAGNATRGYIQSRSLFYWWGVQWFEPGAETQHGLPILLTALWLFWRNVRIEKTITSVREPAGRSPAFAMMGGMLVHLTGYALQQTRISIVGLLLFLWGVLALVGGRRWGSAAVFPVAFTLMAVPIGFLDAFSFQLRMMVVREAVGLAHNFGVNVIRNGTQLMAADGGFQYDVAAACSGVRSLVALFALALLVGYLGLRSRFARLVVLASCLPVVVVANVARILGIILVADRYGQAAGLRFHDWSGLVVFGVALGLLLVLVAILRRVGGAARSEPEAATENEAPVARLESSPWRTTIAVLATAAVVGVAVVALGQRQAASGAGVRLSDDGTAPAELPAFIGTEWVGRQVPVSAIEREVLPPDTGYSRKNYVSVADINRQVFVSVVLSGRDRTSIHRPELCLAGQGWTVTDRTEQLFQMRGETVPYTLLRIEHAARGPKGEAVQVHSLLAYWFVAEDAVEATHWGMQRRDILDRVWHFRANRWAYVVAQTVVLDRDEAGAQARIQEVVGQIWPLVRPEK